MTKVKKYHKSQRKHHKIRKIPQKSKNNTKVKKNSTTFEKYHKNLKIPQNQKNSTTKFEKYLKS